MSVEYVFPTKMEHANMRHLIPGILCAVLACLTSRCDAVKSTQQDIDRIAMDLEFKVYVEANHFSKSTYDIVYILKNNGNHRILDTDDWEIRFSLNNANMMSPKSVTVAGFTITEHKGNIYKMSADRTFPGIKPFNGQKSNNFKITIQCVGLSTSKFDLQPNYFVLVPGSTLKPRTIQSTRDTYLGFVEMLDRKDGSNPTQGILTAVDRVLKYPPSPTDGGGIPPTMVIPRPVHALVNRMQPEIDLSKSKMFYISFIGPISQVFKKRFENTLLSIEGVTRRKLNLTHPPQDDGDIVEVSMAPNNISDDFYSLEIGLSPKNQTVVEITARAEIGLHYAVESLKGILGLGHTLPARVTIQDGPRYDYRAVTLDQTSFFYGLTQLKKFLELMSTYKLSKLILGVGDDYGWRIAAPATLGDLNKVHRCVDEDSDYCVPPSFGVGAEPSASVTGYLSEKDFIDLLHFAKERHIDIIPKINFFGGMRIAKQATHIRYQKLLNTDPAEANRLHLYQGPLAVPAGTELEEKASLDGLLNHCSSTTFAFIKEIIQGIQRLYDSARVPMTGLHAGGDELTQFIKYFPSCESSSATILKKSMKEIRSYLNAGTALHVNQEVITNPDNGRLIEEDFDVPEFKTSHQIVHCSKTFVDGLDKLDKVQKDFLFAPVEPYPDPRNPSATPDPLKPYDGPVESYADWLIPYAAANKGYQIILEAENLYTLDTAQEVDFNEPGTRQKFTAHFVNMYKIMGSEPENLFISNDLTRDGRGISPSRLCKVYSCMPLTNYGKRNMLGIGATINSKNIKNPTMLWYMILPRLCAFAERAWRESAHENHVKAENPDTMVKGDTLELRSSALSEEIEFFSNTMAYNELPRLEEAGYPYRICALGGSIRLGAAIGVPPPYPVNLGCDLPSPNIEFIETHKPNQQWKPLFKTHAGTVFGGYTFSFPKSNQEIAVRVRSPRGTRVGKAVKIAGDIKNYLPKEVPIAYREGTCTSIRRPMDTDIDKLTLKQWTRILQNIELLEQENRMFEEQRNTTVTAKLAELNRILGANIQMREVIMEIDRAIFHNERLENRREGDPAREIYIINRNLNARRQRIMVNRYTEWQQEFEKCKLGQATVTLRNMTLPAQSNIGPQSTEPPQEFWQRLQEHQARLEQERRTGMLGQGATAGAPGQGQPGASGMGQPGQQAPSGQGRGARPPGQGQPGTPGMGQQNFMSFGQGAPGMGPMGFK